MDFSRRTFLKGAGLGSLGLALSSLGFDMPKVKAAVKTFKLTGAREFTSRFVIFVRAVADKSVT